MMATSIYNHYFEQKRNAKKRERNTRKMSFFLLAFWERKNKIKMLKSQAFYDVKFIVERSVDASN